MHEQKIISMTRQYISSGLTMGSVSDLTLETVILLVLGMFMIIFGLLQCWIDAGVLPYNPDSTYGLLLVLSSIQVITIGKTPFGTLRRTWLVILIGMGMAILGTIACFITGCMHGIIRELVGLLLIASGISLFLQLIIYQEKAQRWIRFPGILRYLTIACGLVYLMEVVFGVITLFPSLVSNLIEALLSLMFGFSLFLLAWCIQSVWQQYHECTSGDDDLPRNPRSSEEHANFLLKEANVSPTISFFLLLGVIFILFALLLIVVYHGIFLFSRDSQFGLLMVIMAVQVLALGKTPFGEYTRSWPLIFLGLVIVTLGIYSCIVPGLITGWILIPMGINNLITGGVGLGKVIRPMIRSGHNPFRSKGLPHPAARNLLVTVILLYFSTLFFGMNVIIPGLFPAVAVPVILFFLGVLMLILARIMINAPKKKIRPDEAG